jgi:hypothetical protein
LSGFSFQGVRGSQIPVPDRAPYLAANNLNGTGTPPASQLYAGDLCVLTTKSTLTDANADVVCRMLLQADKAANYKQGTPVAGILGVNSSPIATNSVGVVQALGPLPGGTIYTIPGDSASYGADFASGRNYVVVDRFGGSQQFGARLDLNFEDFPTGLTLQHQLDNTLAGIQINFYVWTLTFTGTTSFVVGGNGTGTYGSGTFTGGVATSSLGTASTAAQIQTALRTAMTTALYPASVVNSVTVSGTAGAAMTITSPFAIFLYPGTAGSVSTTNITGPTGQGQPFYTVQVGTGVASVGNGAAAADECLRIIAPVETDPLYNTLCPASTLGPLVLVEVLGTFQQGATGINYSSN